jgi:hypothetical protein
MNKRQIITLWTIALALGLAVAAVKFTQKKSTDSATQRTPGQTLLESFPAADVSRIEVRGGTESTTLEKNNGVWTIAERAGYPSNTRKINEFLRTVSELKVAQGIEAGPSFAPRFGIDETATDASKRGTTLAFKDSSGKEIARISLGKTLETGASANPMGGPSGRFVRNHADESGFYTVSETFSNLSADPKQWLDHTFVTAEKIQSIRVTAPGKTDVAWKLTRSDENAEFTLDGKPLDPVVASSMKTFFAFPRFDDVIPADQVNDRILTDQKRTAVLETFEGITYTLDFSPARPNPASAADDPENPIPPAEDNYFLTVVVSGEPLKERTKEAGEKEEDAKTKDAAFAERLKTLSEKLQKEKAFAGQTFEISKFTIDPLLKTAAELLPKPPASSDLQVPPSLAPAPTDHPTPSSALPTPADDTQE